MKKLFIFLVLLFIPHNLALAKEKLTVYIFTKKGDEISEKLVSFLEDLKKTDLKDSFNYIEYEVWDENWRQDEYLRRIADKAADYFDDTIIGAPYIVIGDKYRLDEYSTDNDEEIKSAIKDAIKDKDYKDLIKDIIDKEKEKQKKDAISISLISMGIILTTLIFIIFSRKNKS